MRRPLRPDEESLAVLLARTGMSRPAARCLACLTRGSDWTSVALAEAVGLSQPAVSQGMRELADAGLAKRAQVRTGEKGRPAHLYTIAGAAEAVLRAVEERRRAELKAEIEALDALKALIARFA